MSNSLSCTPIGYVRCDRRYRYETPRQGVLAGSEPGRIELLPGMNFEQALVKLETFDRIWVVYRFHLNDNWKPMVQPPRHTREKVGVFATRAPYRPNPIGMSCVRLLGVEGLTLHIAEFDMLDGTPVLDIKPYLPFADSFPDAGTGWTGNHEAEYTVTAAHEAVRRMEWLLERGGPNLRRYAGVQLQSGPRDSERKRITAGEHSMFVLAYRTWRIRYTVDDAARTVTVTGISSGYTPEEVADSENDKYGDKHLHREFGERFGE